MANEPHPGERSGDDGGSVRGRVSLMVAIAAACLCMGALAISPRRRIGRPGRTECGSESRRQHSAAIG